MKTLGTMRNIGRCVDLFYYYFILYLFLGVDLSGKFDILTSVSFKARTGL